MTKLTHLLVFILCIITTAGCTQPPQDDELNTRVAEIEAWMQVAQANINSLAESVPDSSNGAVLYKAGAYWDPFGLGLENNLMDYIICTHECYDTAAKQRAECIKQGGGKECFTIFPEQLTCHLTCRDAHVQ